MSQKYWKTVCAALTLAHRTILAQKFGKGKPMAENVIFGQ